MTAQSPRLPQALRARILALADHRCQSTMHAPGNGDPASNVVHINPPSLGGRWADPSNLRAACPACYRLHARRVSARIQREQEQAGPVGAATYCAGGEGGAAVT